MAKFIKADAGPRHTVIYTDETGAHFRFSEGTWAWRNHNPGNIWPGNIAKRHNQIGIAGKLAVFPDRESGHEALLDVLISTFGNKSIDEMVKKYAPPTENNTAAYAKYLHKATGVADNRKIKDFTPEEFEKLWKAIEQMEGYKEGKITPMDTIVQVRKNKSRVLCEYCLESSNWISKTECLALTEQGKLDVEHCMSRAGNAYLRTRPGSSFQKDLSDLVEKKSKK